MIAPCPRCGYAPQQVGHLIHCLNGIQLIPGRGPERVMAKEKISTNDVIAAHDFFAHAGPLRLRDVGVGARWWRMTAQCAKHGLLVRYEEAETPPTRTYVHCLPCKNETGRDRECEVRDTDLFVGQPPLLFGGGDLGPSD